MATIDTDTLISITHLSTDRQIGQESVYATTAHLGSNKTIDGWQWDERTWPVEAEFKSVAYAPSIWDPSASGISTIDFQSGHGDNDDLVLHRIEEVTASGQDIWAPRVQHGYFYVHDKEWYLFSDYYISESFTVTGVEASQQVLTLRAQNKPTIPIQVRNWKYNHTTNEYETYLDFRKKVEFSVSGDRPEFRVDTTTNPPKLILDDLYSDTIGTSISLTSSGTASPSVVQGLNKLGISDGTADQVFLTTYCPIDYTQDVEIWSWLDPSYPTQWAVINPLDDFVGSGKHVKVDTDIGSVSFGNYDEDTGLGHGARPRAGSRIGAYYTTTVAALYEAIFTGDDVLAYSDEADINPITSAISNGFVQVTTTRAEPVSIVLTSDLPLVSGVHTIEIGNNTGKMTGTVKDGGGNLLEGQQVTFNILDPKKGTFGATAVEATAITDEDGEATTTFNAPATIDSLGRYTTNISLSGGDTVIQIDGLTPPSDLSRFYIYRVHEEDLVLGIPESNLDNYYTEYLTEEDVPSGVQGVLYEKEYRTIHELEKPTTYSVSDISTGKKTILLTTRAGVMNPHTGTIDPATFAALNPSVVENIGTTEVPVLKITYSGVNLDLPGTNDTKSYFLIGEHTTRVQAFATGSRTNKKAYSNILDVDIRVSDSMNGTFYADLLSDIPAGLLTSPINVNDLSVSQILTTSEYYYENYLDERLYYTVSGKYEKYEDWFLRTRRGDTVGITGAGLDGLESITPLTAPAEIPLGFRLKGSSVTIASVLDAVTFLDPNDLLPDGYF